MTPDDKPTQTTLSPQDVFSSSELDQLCQRIIASGILGRSKHYSAMLEYLVKCSAQNRQPKEIDLATDVLGKDGDFDVSVDSSVRVYVHQLRKKLSAYYEQNELDAAYRLVIPKGSYSLAAIATTPVVKPASFFFYQVWREQLLAAGGSRSACGESLVHVQQTGRGERGALTSCRDTPSLGYGVGRRSTYIISYGRLLYLW